MKTIHVGYAGINHYTILLEDDTMFLLDIFAQIKKARIVDYSEPLTEIRFDAFTASERAMFESLIPEGFEVRYV